MRSALIVLGCSVAFMGCTGGGGGGFSASSASAVTSANAQRATSYGWSSADLSALPDGYVSALATAPTGTDTLAATVPSREVALVNGGAPTVEGGFGADVGGLATVGTTVFAGTFGATGAGDLYQRGASGWTRVLDGPGDRMVVAAHAGGAYALTARRGDAELSALVGGSWTTRTGLFPVAFTPTAAASDGVDLWVGGQDQGAPTSSLLVQKTDGTVAHGGGAPWRAGSVERTTILSWIQDGAPLNGTGAAPAPPPLPTRPTYLVDVKPIMSACVGCHSRPGFDDMPLSANLANDRGDYTTIVRQTNQTTPTSSSLLRRGTGRDHPVKVFDVGSRPYQILELWIKQGVLYQ
ncbi:MAG: hypothetical protein AB7N76_08935 [Planctomycetota bacterium]